MDSLRILLIDDDEDSFLIIQGLLAGAQGPGYALDWERSYQAGLEALNRGGYDACLLDYHLGARDGLDLLREAVKAGCRTPIIFVTGRGDRTVDLQAMKAGAADFLEKGRLETSWLERSIRYTMERQASRVALDKDAETLKIHADELDHYRAMQIDALNRALNDRLAELEAIFDIAPVGIWIAHDPECKKITFNRCAAELLQVPRGSSLSPTAPGEEWHDFKICRGGKDMPLNELPLQHAAARGVPVTLFECDLHLKDGRILHLLWNALPLFDRNGLVRGAIATAWDITSIQDAAEEKRLFEVKILHAQKLRSLGVLAGGIAHDFNNILTGIMGYADLILLELAPAQPTRNYVQQIIAGTQQAAELAGQMLAYSGRSRFVFQPVHLSEVIAEMKAPSNAKCVLNYHLEPDLPAVEADVVQLRQIVTNLILNASEAIGDRGGSVGVTTGIMDCTRSDIADCSLGEDLPEGRYVFVEVADTGCGMTEETLARIFEPFFTTKMTGRGLGLAAMQGIVRSHRGVIRATSQLGRGTTFRVLFPTTERMPVSRATVLPAGPATRSGGTILVIDDEQSVRDLAGFMLRRMGFEVLLATDGRAGVEVFKAQRDGIDAVLLDLTMPKMGGAETFQELRQIRPDVRVVLSSGYSAEIATGQFGGGNLAGFLQKPYRYEALAEVIRKAVSPRNQ